MATKQSKSNAVSNMAASIIGKAKGKQVAPALSKEQIVAIEAAAQAAVDLDSVSTAAREGKKSIEVHRAAMASLGIKFDAETLKAVTKSTLATVGAALKLAPNPKARTKPLPVGAMRVLLVAIFAGLFRKEMGADLTDVGFTSEAFDKARRDKVSVATRRTLRRLAPHVATAGAEKSPKEKAVDFAKRLAPDVAEKGIAALVQAFKAALEEAVKAKTEEVETEE